MKHPINIGQMVPLGAILILASGAWGYLNWFRSSRELKPIGSATVTFPILTSSPSPPPVSVAPSYALEQNRPASSLNDARTLVATPSPQPTSTPNPWQLSPYPVIHFLRETKIHRIDSRSFEILGPDPGAVIHIELTPIDFKPSMVGPDPDMQRFYDSEVKKMKRWGAEFQLLSKTEFIKDSTPFADYFTCKLVYAVAPRRKKEQLGYLLLYSSNIWNLKIDARFPAEKLKKYSKLSELIETRFWLYIFRSGIDYREANASQLVLNFEVSQKDIDGRSSKYKDSASNEYIDLMVDLQK